LENQFVSIFDLHIRNFYPVLTTTRTDLNILGCINIAAVCFGW